jgi:elongation factor G
VEGKDPKGKAVVREVDGPLAALAFKVMNDPYTGTLTFLRVYSGKLVAGSSVFNQNSGKKERVGRLVKMHANQREPAAALSPWIQSGRVRLAVLRP